MSQIWHFLKAVEFRLSSMAFSAIYLAW